MQRNNLNTRYGSHKVVRLLSIIRFLRISLLDCMLDAIVPSRGNYLDTIVSP